MVRACFVWVTRSVCAPRSPGGTWRVDAPLFGADTEGWEAALLGSVTGALRCLLETSKSQQTDTSSVSNALSSTSNGRVVCDINCMQVPDHLNV